MLWKYYKNIMNVTFFFKFLPKFRQQHFFFLPFSTMTLPQFHSIFFPIFGNAIATITKKIFSFFFSLFRQWHCRNCLFFFFFWALHTRAHGTQDSAAKLGRGILVSTLPKFNIFSLHLFLLLSHTFGWISAMVIPKFSLFPQNPK